MLPQSIRMAPYQDGIAEPPGTANTLGRRAAASVNTSPPDGSDLFELRPALTANNGDRGNLNYGGAFGANQPEWLLTAGIQMVPRRCRRRHDCPRSSSTWPFDTTARKQIRPISNCSTATQPRRKAWAISTGSSNGTMPRRRTLSNATAIKSSTTSTSTIAIRSPIIQNTCGQYSSTKRTTASFRSRGRQCTQMAVRRKPSIWAACS